jgi:hypothetical protein
MKETAQARPLNPAWITRREPALEAQHGVFQLQRHLLALVRFVIPQLMQLEGELPDCSHHRFHLPLEFLDLRLVLFRFSGQ